MRTVTRPDRGVQDFELAPVPWDAFQAEILTLYNPPHAAPGTRRKMVQVLDAVKALGVTSTAELTVPLVARYASARPAGQSEYTLQAHLCCLRTICSYAEMSGYLRVSPFRIRRLSSWVRPPELDGKRHWTREEIRRLLDLLANDVKTRSGWGEWRARRLQCVVAIIAYCGLRKTECLRLHVSDLDVETGIIDLKPHGQKLKTAGSQKIVPMPDALIPIVQSWLAHRMDAPFGFPLPKECPWAIPTLSRLAPWVSGHTASKPLARLQAAGKRAGLDGLTFHSLRRSLATHLEYFGAGESAIQRILRHSSGETTKRFYRRADALNLRSIVASVDF
jgi:integrase